MTAPFGRRLCEVSRNEASGGYRLFSLIDADGPEPQPGQFYMLATEHHWEQSGARPFLPRALSVAEASPLTSSFFPDSGTKDEVSGRSWSCFSCKTQNSASEVASY